MHKAEVKNITKNESKILTKTENVKQSNTYLKYNYIVKYKKRTFYVNVKSPNMRNYIKVNYHKFIQMKS